jgi:hypothetical protein
VFRKTAKFQANTFFWWEGNETTVKILKQTHCWDRPKLVQHPVIWFLSKKFYRKKEEKNKISFQKWFFFSMQKKVADLQKKNRNLKKLFFVIEESLWPRQKFVARQNASWSSRDRHDTLLFRVSCSEVWGSNPLQPGDKMQSFWTIPRIYHI